MLACIARRWFSSTSTLTVSFVTPSKTVLRKATATSIKLNTNRDGQVGILADHVPSIFQLAPGAVHVQECSEKYETHFISGGFAVVNPDSTVDISAMEAIPLSHIDPALVSKNLASISDTVTDPTLKVQNDIHRQVYSALSSSLTP